MSRIFVLEDQEESYFLIKRAVDNQHSLTWVKTIAEAMQTFNKDFDLALIDIELPDGDGFQFCDWIRAQKATSSIPIMFISAKGAVESRITGFSIGGDDYITKPFNIVELKARIEAKLRWKNRDIDHVLGAEGISLDLRAQHVQIQNQLDSKWSTLDLTPIEFKILNLFLNEPNKALSRDEILNKIWGDGVYVYPRSVDTHVSKLRSKLGEKSGYIKSVHGVGYKFSTENEPDDAIEDHIPSSKMTVLYHDKDLAKSVTASSG
ncbi:MAG: hypothetical protein A2Z20_02405 [Bdellovibrionales bacterium RBG_16_40_8]|nr:MAG: hypothetical protein A2Z20_02405 [Bdellovibrionales bacterium RBG_16_40_8]